MPEHPCKGVTYRLNISSKKVVDSITSYDHNLFTHVCNKTPVRV